MEKMRMETENLTDANIQKILELFPNVATEKEDENGKIKTAIDFEKLKQELSEDNVADNESYDFTWVGKRKAMIEANTPIRKTLRPQKEKSINWDTTKNIYIEGDNLEALKLLRKSYMGQVKMIYIDPPYNTGKDFIYRDNFTKDKESYDEETGARDEEGNRLFQNTESNGRFHSEWCSMMYSRLRIARDLLKKDGVIYISISDKELVNLRKICDEVFGENNFLTNIVWTNKEGGGSSDSSFYKTKHEYIVCLTKNPEELNLNGQICQEDSSYSYSDEFVNERGKYKLIKLNSFSIQYSKSLDYEIEMPNGEIITPSENGKKGCWRWSKDKFLWGVENKFIEFKQNQEGKMWVYTKQYFKVDNENNVIQRTLPPLALIDKYSSTMATKQLESLFNKKGMFDYSKPYLLIKDLVYTATDKDSIILDFFSGSATTAHSVMQLNAEDDGKRKFIMVQLPELTDEKSEAYKNGYRNICQIGEERIKLAGEKIKEENPNKSVDTGFRVFKVDTSSMEDVFYTPDKLTQLDLFENNIKADRTDEDLLYGCLLDWGIELSLPHKIETVDNKRIHIIDDRSVGPAFVACFENNISENVIKNIAERKPMHVVFRDSSFGSDDSKINVTEIFKYYSPDTKIRVL